MKTEKQNSHEKSKNITNFFSSKRLYKFCYCFLFYFFVVSSFVSGGFVLNVVGVTISDLAKFTDSNEVVIGYAFVSRSVGMVVGSGFCGFLCDLSTMNPSKNKFYHITHVKILCFSVVLMMISIFFTPVSKIAAISVIIQFFAGLGWGTLLVVCTILVDNIWKDFSKAKRFFQFSLHLNFGMAAFLCPLICGEIFRNNYSSSVNLIFCYGLTLTTLFIPIFLIFFKSPEKHDEKEIEEKKEESSESGTNESIENKQISSSGKFKRLEQIKKIIKNLNYLRVCFVFFGFLVMLFYSFIDCGAGWGLFLFLTRSGFEKSVAAYYTSMYFGVYTLSRLVTAIFSTVVHPVVVLFVDVIGLFFTYVLFSFFPTNVVIITICTCLVSFFASTVVPAMVQSINGIPQLYNIVFSGYENSVVVVGISLGSFSPFFTGYMMDVWRNEAYVFLGLIYSIIFFFLVIIYNIFGIVYRIKELKEKMRVYNVEIIVEV